MQQQGGGGSQYGGAPAEMPPFAATGTDPLAHVLAEAATQQQLKLGDPSLGVAEAASPISSRPPAVAGNFEDLLPVSGGGGLPDEDPLGGDEADRGGGGGSSVGNRWPRQETLALLKVRSEMDAVFRDATLKGPLWEDVSRKLAELGYKRSAKKCKEKFENVHKYYKRTKEGRAGRQDGKSYRFFSQLEALQRASSSGSVSAAPAILATPTATMAIPSTATNATTATANLVGVPAPAPVPVPVPVSIGIGFSNPMPISSIRTPSTISTMPPQPQPPSIGVNLVHPLDFSGGAAPKVSGSATAAAANFGISFSSDSSASSSGSEDMEEDDELEAEEMEMDNEPANTRNRKRKRGSSPKSSTSRRMMEFFEGLMKQVMQKQEAMQKRFLETIEKREQDRMIREEAWKRQEMARLAREHELMAQERAISASRDAAIISFLQKITGQTIQLPHPVTIPADPPPPPPIIIPPPPSAPVPPPSQQQYQKPQPQQQQHYQQHQQQQQQQQLHQSAEVIVRHQSTLSSEIVVAVPEQQVAPQDIGGSGSFEAASSSRWPKTEVLALINLRSGLESKYQEAGPKGPLWEEISAGMHRMGYKRSAKRCKEKWENINKYFKKVKESNKKRPEDAKTCPYFHQLDALYQKKIIGNTGTSSTATGANLLSIENRQEQQQMQQQQQESMMMMDSTPTTKQQERSDVPMLVPSPHTAKSTIESEKKDEDNNANLQNSNGGLAATLFGESSSGGVGGVKNPEDTVKEQNGQNQQEQQLMMDAYDKIEEPNSDNLDEEEEEEDDDDDDDDGDDEEAEEQMKMAYKIQFQRQNAGSSNGGGNGAPSFLAMVQ